jgi:hypothetical protein
MIRTYANTTAELHIEEERLHLLMERKDELYTRFFPITSRISDTSSHTNKRTDNMANYIAELEKINPVTGMSLDNEIETTRNKVGTLKYYLKRMEENLEKATGIEYELFNWIVIKGFNPTRAVEFVAEKYKKEPNTIWKYYYPKIKEEISKCIVNVK